MHCGWLDESVMSDEGTGEMIVITSSINVKVRTETLDSLLIPSDKIMFIDDDFIFQNNSSCLRAKDMITFNTYDVNPAKLIWQLQSHSLSHTDEEHCVSLVRSIPQRILSWYKCQRWCNKVLLARCFSSWLHIFPHIIAMIASLFPLLDLKQTRKTIVQ